MRPSPSAGMGRIAMKAQYTNVARILRRGEIGGIKIAPSKNLHRNTPLKAIFLPRFSLLCGAYNLCSGTSEEWRQVLVAYTIKILHSMSCSLWNWGGKLWYALRECLKMCNSEVAHAFYWNLSAAVKWAKVHSGYHKCAKFLIIQNHCH